MKRLLVRLLILPIYGLGCLCYDKKYLTGKNFDRSHFSVGWSWILRDWFGQKVLGRNRHVPWPVPPGVSVGEPANILFDPDDMRNFRTQGTYFQGVGGKVIIGKGCMIAPGAGFITANHDPGNLLSHKPGKDVRLGEGCWIGMNAVLLPGVELGPHTVVGAGAVVTKSFPEGNCVVAGNPARKLRALDPADGGAVPGGSQA